MKADRLLSAVMLLQAHGRLSTREIAERLNVSQRTAHRDMEALCYAGIPLIAIRGSTGGWELEKGWRTKVPGLDEAELRALLMAQPSALGDPWLIAAAERAFGKLMAAMTGSMQTQAAVIRARVHIDSTGWWPSIEDLSFLPAVQEAVVRDLRVTFVYTRADGETNERTVDPLGLVCKQTIWYLIARTPAGMRTYRISRMSEVTILGVSFDRPGDFDLAAYWKASTAQLKARRYYPATLALTPDAATSIRRWVRVSPATSVPETHEDWVTLDVEFEGEDQAKFAVLGFGSRVRVLAPEELRERVVAEVKEVFARHQWEEG
jgi:predicted DNA-binding transcriptional regulator YafY